jgi:hypothetical protein
MEDGKIKTIEEIPGDKIDASKYDDRRFAKIIKETRTTNLEYIYNYNNSICQKINNILRNRKTEEALIRKTLVICRNIYDDFSEDLESNLVFNEVTNLLSNSTQNLSNYEVSNLTELGVKCYFDIEKESNDTKQFCEALASYILKDEKSLNEENLYNLSKLVSKMAEEEPELVSEIELLKNYHAKSQKEIVFYFEIVGYLYDYNIKDKNSEMYEKAVNNYTNLVARRDFEPSNHLVNNIHPLYEDINSKIRSAKVANGLVE